MARFQYEVWREHEYVGIKSADWANGEYATLDEEDRYVLSTTRVSDHVYKINISKEEGETT